MKIYSNTERLNSSHPDIKKISKWKLKTKWCESVMNEV